MRLQRLAGLIAPTLILGALAVLPAAAHPGAPVKSHPSGPGHGPTAPGGTPAAAPTPGSATGAGASQDPGSAASSGTGTVPDSEAAVCDSTVPAGYARCNAHVRTDSNVRGHAPARPGSRPVGPASVGGDGAYAPSWLQSAYNDPAFGSTAGAGQIVAIVDAYDAPNVTSDLSTYRGWFGLAPCTTAQVPTTGKIVAGSDCSFYKVNQSGAQGSYPRADSGWAQEISLDVDMVSAMCPLCTIVLVEANDNSLANLGASVNEAVNLGADVVSNSYGGGEYSSELTDASNYYNHPGVAVVASSGDNGYGVEFPAASSYVTAVGGTSLYQGSNTGTRGATESAWSGAGSGCSAYVAKPSWQKDTGCSRRTVADVSAVADPNTGVWVYDGGWYVFGGTSVASPIVGSLFAVGGKLTGPGTAVPQSWPYNSSASLNDMTTGSNGSCTVSYLCHAVIGYDGPTGLGTPNGTAAFTGVIPPPTAPGAPQNLSAQAGNASVTLSWSPPSSSGGATITSYNVFRGTSPNAEATVRVNSVSGTTLTFTDTGLTNGTTYYYKVAAFNSVGQGPMSNEASATPAALPGAPQSLTAATSSTRGVLLKWTVGTDAGGSYRVYRGTRSGGETLLTTTTCATTTSGQQCSYADTNTHKGTLYYYKVAAVNAAGTGPQSNEASAKAR